MTAICPARLGAVYNFVTVEPMQPGRRPIAQILMEVVTMTLQEETATTQGFPAPTANGCGRGQHILVINDTQEILDLFRELLEEEGYRVTLSSYTFQEVRDVARVAPDLVILDFIIGGEAHGWQMLQKMKMTRATADIPIIVCTAALKLARELEGHLREKDVLVVLKPFDIDELLHAVQLTLDSKVHGTPVTPE